MKFYEKDNDKYKCLLCSHYCKLNESQVGICGVNKNVGEEIECLVYGKISAFNVDPIEKKPLYHFLPNTKSLSLGTVGCNFKCSFCQNWTISQEKNISKSTSISVDEIINLAVENRCDSISYTYNEPTIFYPFAKDVALKAKEHGIKNIFVSNGFESKEVIDDMKGIIDAINIDLKTFNNKYYKELGGNLDIVCENLKHFYKNGIWLEITTLLVPSKNDSDEELKAIASFIKNELGKNVPWHISAFHPDYKETQLERTPFSSLERAYHIGKNMGLNYIYIGNVGYENSTCCKKCGAELIKRGSCAVKENNLRNSSCINCNTKLDGVYE